MGKYLRLDNPGGCQPMPGDGFGGVDPRLFQTNRLKGCHFGGIARGRTGTVGIDVADLPALCAGPSLRRSGCLIR